MMKHLIVICFFSRSLEYLIDITTASIIVEENCAEIDKSPRSSLMLLAELPGNTSLVLC